VVLFAALVGITVMLLHQAYGRWAPTHGHGILGTWTASREERGYKYTDWFGDFTPADGGPVRHEVRLDSSVPILQAGQSIAAATLGQHSDAMSITDRNSWVPVALFGAGFATGAGLIGWLVMNDPPAVGRRRRIRAWIGCRMRAWIGYGGRVRIGNVEFRPLGGATGCLLMILASVVLSVVLTVLLNVLL
jgi:hypothetical protein